MSKWKGKLAKRIMAVFLSGAMVMSNMSAYAAEITSEPETEVVSEAEESSVAEATEDASVEESVANENTESAETETTTVENTESKSEVTMTEDIAEKENTTEESTEAETGGNTTSEIKTEEEIEVETKTKIEETTETETETETVDEQTSETEESETDNKEEAVADGVYILNPDTAISADKKDNKDTTEAIECGKDNYFTINPKVKIESRSSATKFTVDNKSVSISSRIKFGGNSKATEKSIKFEITTGKVADIVVCATSSGDSADSQMQLCKIDGTPVTGTSTKLTRQEKPTTVWKNIKAGEYYIAGYKPEGITGNVNVYYVQVTESDDIPSERGEWDNVVDPAIESVALDEENKNNIIVTVNGKVDPTGEGADKVIIDMYDTNEISATTEPVISAESETKTTDTDGKHISKVPLSPNASGSYYFKARLVRAAEGETEFKDKSSDLTEKFDFTLPLKAPEIDKVAELEDGSYDIMLKSVVKEADSYKINIYSDEECKKLVKELTATNEKTTDETTGEEKISPAKVNVEKGILANGYTYYITAVAIRGTEEPLEYSDVSKVFEREIPEIELGVKHTFEAKALETFNNKGADESKKKTSEVIGPENYFTIYYGPDSEVSTNSKKWSDGYESNQRVNFRGGIDPDKVKEDLTLLEKHSIKFVTTDAVTVKVWWVPGDADRHLAIFDTEGKIAAETTGKTAGSTTYKSEFKLNKAGTYYLSNKKDSSYLFKVEVVEEPKGLSSDLDLSQDLKAGTVYGSTDLATLEVLEDMASKGISEGKEIGGEKYYYSVQGSSNASPNKGDIPTSGAAFKITAYKETTVSFVTGAANNKAWHVVRESDKKEVLKGNSIPEGTISFRAQEGQTYYFYADGSKVKAYAISLSEYIYIPRADWAEIPNPVIMDHEINEGEISIIVKGNISRKGGDSITVEMYDADPDGDPDKVIASKSVSTEGKTSTIKISPSSSGTYFFKAFLSRNAEESVEDAGEEITFDDKESNRYPAEGGIEFHYILEAPLINAVTNLGAGEDGKGAVEVDWGKTSEATGYEVIALNEAGEEAGKITTEQKVDENGKVTEAARIGNISGLTVGEKYKIKVCAVRKGVNENGEPTIDSSPYSTETEVIITAEKKIKWAFSASGSSTSIKDADPKKKPAGYGANTAQPKNGYHKPDADGNGEKDNGFDVEVWSIDGAGKVVPNTVDGLAFYYTTVEDPEHTNFTLSATAHIESWKLSNGQDGFGLMASDIVGENGNGDYVWTNCYQNVVSKIEFRWDGTKPADYSDVSTTRYSMKIGVGGTEKLGATAKDVEDIKNGIIAQPPAWTTSQYPLDYSMTHLPAGTYNVAGNYTYDKETEIPENSLVYPEILCTDFDLKLEKNNNGYKLSYTNVKSGETVEKQYYGADVLNQIEKDKVYVGVFASRNADVTFKNVTLETRDPSQDPPAQEQEITHIALTTAISSPSTTNTSDYDLVFTSNWDGELVVKDSDMKVVAKTKVTGTLDTKKALLPNSPSEPTEEDKDTKTHIALSGLNIGSNAYTLTFTPSKKMENPPAYTELNSYEPVTLTHTVDFRKYGEENAILYVAPNGKSSGTGTKANPLDIHTAIKYVQPGQKIFLAGGTYSLNKTITIAKGINGTKDKMIYMMADPEATERPVFDFNKKVTGMTMGGDYWYFKGFDVTHSSDGQKGIQVSGSNNVLDQINAYYNGNTGIQVSGSGNDTYKYWPQNNKILNCTSYLNSDAGYEDADGFAAKLTIGSGNVFDGCIAAYNADDGWDLFAKIESGQIGSVTIKNSIAYRNGYVLMKGNELSLFGTEVDAGNGNGFKMGGDGLPGGSIYDDYYKETGEFKGHILENSLAFENKSKGFDSNSCSNNKIRNSVSFNNKGGNVELYTYNNVQETYYEVKDVISFRTKNTSVVDSVDPKGAQIKDKSAFINDSTYLWNKRPNASVNKSGIKVDKSWFKSTTFTGTKESNYVLFGRDENGKIITNGFMEVIPEKVGTTDAPIGLDPTGSPTDKDLIGEDSKETSGDVSAGNGVIADEDNSGELVEEEEKYANEHGINIVPVLENGVSYTGQAVKPEIRVYLNGKRFTDYSVSYKNNINAYVEGDENYADIPDEKRPQMILKLKGSYQYDYIYYFDIKPVDISNKKKVAAPSIAVDKAQVPKVTLTFNGKNLSLGKDFNIYKENISKDENGVETVTGETLVNKEVVSDEYTVLKVRGIGNYTGCVDVPFIIVDTGKLALMSKANVKVATNSYLYTGKEILPEITVDGTALKLNEDKTDYADDLYDVSIANGIEVGKAIITVTAKVIAPPTEEGAPTLTATYAGSKTIPVTIKKSPIKLENIAIEGFGEGDALKNVTHPKPEYTGAAKILPGKITIKVDGEELYGLKKGSRNINDAGENVQYKYNYTYEYKNNLEAGTANLIIKGIHNCTGSVSIKFKIDPASVSSATPYKKADGQHGVEGEKRKGEGLEIVYDSVVDYVSTGAKPSIAVFYNGNGVSQKNYSVAYKNNRNVGTDASFIITWKGSLKNAGKTDPIPYEIKACPFEGNVYAKSVYDVFTNGKTEMKASEFEKSKAVIMNGKTKLAIKRDYTLEYRYTGYEDAKEGEEPKLISGKYVSGSRDNTLISVPATGLNVEVWAVPVPGGNYTGDAIWVANIRAARYDIAKANIKLLDENGKNAVLYFKDPTEQAAISSSKLNILDSKYIKIYHAAYAKEYGGGAKDFYLQKKEYAKRTDGSVGTGYAYDENATDAASAGTQSVTFYGTGLFGGSKVFKYKLEKKTYNISKAIVDTTGEISMTVASNEYKKDRTITPDAKRQIEAGLAKGFEGKITNVNGLTNVLSSNYYECEYDKDFSNWESGKAITVIIKGKNSYSGSKKVKVRVSIKVVSDDFTTAEVKEPITVTDSESNIAKGITLDEAAFADKFVIDGYVLSFDVDFAVNDADYIVYATDESGNYIVDAEGETMVDENGETIKDENGQEIKYKVLRKYKGYYNNKTASTAEAPAYVCLKGIGEFKGIIEVPFTIAAEAPAN